jgi:hypothetical protein
MSHDDLADELKQLIAQATFASSVPAGIALSAASKSFLAARRSLRARVLRLLRFPAHSGMFHILPTGMPKAPLCERREGVYTLPVVLFGAAVVCADEHPSLMCDGSRAVRYYGRFSSMIHSIITIPNSDGHSWTTERSGIVPIDVIDLNSHTVYGFSSYSEVQFATYLDVTLHNQFSIRGHAMCSHPGHVYHTVSSSSGLTVTFRVELTVALVKHYASGFRDNNDYEECIEMSDVAIIDINVDQTGF